MPALQVGLLSRSFSAAAAAAAAVSGGQRLVQVTQTVKVTVGLSCRKARARAITQS